MKNKLIPHTLSALRIIAISSLTIFTLYSVQAVWNPPTSSAPNGNVGGPLTTATSTQIKTGSLGILDNLSIGKTLIVNGSFKFATTSAGVGKVLVSDGEGNASWGTASGGSYGTNLKIAPSYTDLYNQNTVHSSEQTFSCSKGDINPPTDGSVKYVFVYMKGGDGSNGTGTGGAGGFGGFGGKGGKATGPYGGQGADGTLGKGGNGYIEYAGATVNTAGGGGYDTDYSGGTGYSPYDIVKGGQGGGGVAIHTSLLNNYEPILAAGGGASGAQCQSGAGGGGYGGGGAGACWGAASGGGAWIGGGTIRIKDGTGSPYNYTYAFNPYDYGNGPFKVVAGCGGFEWGITGYTKDEYGQTIPVKGMTTTRWDGHGIAKVWW